ncbi:MAG: 5'/3'-nucleotidase SurE [Caldiserica bacterium]|nr:MAG: 5'/3'-nucleotidase SurE [Caldisericota bacterium]
MSKLRILLTNDDGIMGRGLFSFLEELSKIGKTVAVVPQAEASASSHALSLHKALRLRKIRDNLYIVNGTPADCVRLGTLYVLKDKVSIVVSGINDGPNLAEDTIYSGTVAGAREAAMMGNKGIAFSLVKRGDFKKVSRIAADIVKKVIKIDFPEGSFLNVNIPNDSPRGIKITFLGKRVYGREVTVRKDPRGKTYYWIAGEKLGGVSIKGSDYNSIKRGFISITPLSINQTDFEFLKSLNECF